MIYYPYEKFVKDVKSLVIMSKDYRPDAIVAIARGGVTLGHAYASATNNRQLMSVNSILYEDDERGSECEIFNLPNLSKAKKILLVDDIVDSGQTMKEVLARIKLSYPDLEIKILCVYYKKTAAVQADYALHEATEWIEFFWEKDFLQENDDEKN
jgi:xanthine phosphoribosyltransferase